MASKAPAGETHRKILDSGITGTVSRRDIRTAIKAVTVERGAKGGQLTTPHGKAGRGGITKRK